MQIKKIPEDFFVEEVSKLNLKKERADYSIFKLTKTNWDMFKLIEVISKILKIKSKLIGYGGNKDKNAVTVQYISFYKIQKERIENMKINNIKLEFVGYSDERINLGYHDGNNFIIVVRDLNNKVEIPKNLQFENYFGNQRFGNKFNTHLVGKAIIKKDFEKACKILRIKVENNDFIGGLRKQPRRLLRFYISSYQAFIWNRMLSIR